jgi:E3 ubiquitin-protein ligase SDIR1
VKRCLICLETPTHGDVIRTLPCVHQFHRQCVDRWLRDKASCPICNFAVEFGP